MAPSSRSTRLFLVDDSRANFGNHLSMKENFKVFLPRFFLLLSVTAAISCAQLHHVQLGEIQSHPNYVMKPFDIKISETGINLQEAADIAKVFTNSESTRQQADDIAGLIGLFQMGPVTGNPVYVKDYAKNLLQVIYDKCPSGRVTGLSSIRETRKYPVVSGEIVKVTGYCLMPKGG